MNERSRPTGKRGDQDSQPMTSPSLPPAATGEPQVVTEPSAWMRAAAGERLRQIQATGLLGKAAATGTVVVCALGRSGIANPVEDRTCDRCRRHLEPDEGMTGGVYTVPATARVLLTFGLCDGCQRKETGR